MTTMYVLRGIRWFVGSDVFPYRRPSVEWSMRFGHAVMTALPASPKGQPFVRVWAAYPSDTDSAWCRLEFEIDPASFDEVFSSAFFGPEITSHLKVYAREVVNARMMAALGLGSDLAVASLDDLSSEDVARALAGLRNNEVIHKPPRKIGRPASGFASPDTFSGSLESVRLAGGSLESDLFSVRPPVSVAGTRMGLDTPLTVLVADKPVCLHGKELALDDSGWGLRDELNKVLASAHAPSLAGVARAAFEVRAKGW